MFVVVATDVVGVGVDGVVIVGEEGVAVFVAVATVVVGVVAGGDTVGVGVASAVVGVVSGDTSVEESQRNSYGCCVGVVVMEVVMLVVVVGVVGVGGFACASHSAGFCFCLGRLLVVVGDGEVIFGGVAGVVGEVVGVGVEIGIGTGAAVAVSGDGWKNAAVVAW